MSNSDVNQVDGMEDLFLIGSNSKTKAVKKSVKRIDKTDEKVEGNDNYAFSITKSGPAVKSTRKVTMV